MNAGYVSPSKEWYRITDAREHKTLKVGDIVLVVETPSPHLVNLLLRASDMTLHELQDESDQYVHLEQVTPSN